MRRLALLFASLPLACFTAELDPDASGVFACGEDDPCPGDQTCVNARCEAGDPPRVEIINPEEEEAVAQGDTPGMRTVSMVFRGTLDIVDPKENPDNVFGEGHLEVLVEGQSVGTIESGAFSGGVQFDIEVPNEVGPVRVAVQALRNDGSRYDNPEAVARRLFWIDDGDTPLVGIREPWPGTAFPLENEVISVDARVLNFALLPADPTGMIQVATGHVHIYYDVDLNTCLVPDSLCDDSYITTVTSVNPSMATLPDSAAGTAKLSAVLRNIDHSLFAFVPDGGDVGQTIFDEISIVRE